MRNLDQFRGCLIGGAIGDALGYPVEFMTWEQIKDEYGENGIQSYALRDGVARISDDTQMTLFTANGLLACAARNKGRKDISKYAKFIHGCYFDWRKTQGRCETLSEKTISSWLYNVPELHSARAPGHTCMKALMSYSGGTPEKPKNQSKGNGGLMRVAPIGLYFDSKDINIRQILRIGAEAAALTHGHELGYITASALVYIINAIIYSGNAGDISLSQIVLDSVDHVGALFDDKPRFLEFTTIVKKAVDLAYGDKNDIDCLNQLGCGGIAEETLAAAVFCALRYTNDFKKAITVSVNHGGDSDSTGSVTGNIVGAYHGYNRLPAEFLENLELKDIILEIADDLFYDYKEDAEWNRKYLHCEK